MNLTVRERGRSPGEDLRARFKLLLLGSTRRCHRLGDHKPLDSMVIGRVIVRSKVTVRLLRSRASFMMNLEIGNPMTLLMKSILQNSLLQNNEGQDLIEYALLAATLAVVVAGFLPPTIMPAVSTIFSKISNMLSNAPL